MLYVMNGYNRCGGCQAPMVQQPMIYAVPTMQQPMSVKTEMVNMPEKTCDSKMGVPQMAPMPMANQMSMPHPMSMQMPAHACGPMHFESCCQVVEPTVCCMPEVHHHHRVEHIVPVVVRNVHHHHNHHDYVICKQEGMETHQYDHGLRNEDWCGLAMQGQGCPTKPMC